jgi:hypothetical protein
MANLAVVAGLVLVAFQIRQNTETTRAQVVNDYFLADMNLELAMMGDNPGEALVKAIYTPESLTPGDAAVLDRYFNYGLVQLERLEQMREHGYGDSQWEDRVSYLRWHLGNEVGRRWWAYVRNSYPPEFATKVDGIIDVDGNRRLLDALKGPERP